MLLTSPVRRSHSRGITVARHRAFTLVEMLVVISIIAVLAALLLPAVNMAREAARRAQCSNNLRNLALAAQQFDSAKGYYPASRQFWNSPTYSKPASWSTSSAQTVYLNWVMELMPYYEKQDVRGLIETAVSNGKPIFSVASGKLNLVLCPSDELDDPASTPNASPYAQLSYGCNAGVFDNPAPNTTTKMIIFDWSQNGVFDNRLMGSSEPTPIKTPSKTSLGDIAAGDGASNTILLAENADLEEWNYSPVESSVGVVWDDYGIGLLQSNQGIVWQALNKWPQYPGTPSSTKPDSQDSSMTPLQWLSTQTTGLKLIQSGAPSHYGDSVLYARPSSLHPTGFMVAFCDGRVKFVSESISYKTYALLMTSNGKKYCPSGLVQSQIQSPLTGTQTFQQTSAVSDANF